jgi:hypothetical protein
LSPSNKPKQHSIEQLCRVADLRAVLAPKVPIPPQAAGVLPGRARVQEKAEVVGRTVDVQRGTVAARVICLAELHTRIERLDLELPLRRIGVVLDAFLAATSSARAGPAAAVTRQGVALNGTIRRMDLSMCSSLRKAEVRFAPCSGGRRLVKNNLAGSVIYGICVKFEGTTVPSAGARPGLEVPAADGGPEVHPERGTMCVRNFHHLTGHYRARRRGQCG